MTSYSVMSAGPRCTVLATWPGAYHDQTVKVTTLDDGELARDLAVYLTHVSEGSWDAAAWLDTSPVIEAGLTTLIGHLRGPGAEIPRITLAGDGHRHHDQWSFFDVAEVLLDLPGVLTRLTRAQRLTVADELAGDAAGRAEALRVFPARQEPAAESSRAWQILEVTRALHNGLLGPLPEGAAGWLSRAWGSDLGLLQRWAARDRLTRIEQLVAACRQAGGRGEAEHDPELCAHLVVPRDGPATGNDVFYVVAPAGHSGSPGERPDAPMTVNRFGHLDREPEVVAVLDPADDAGFASALGGWTRLVPWSGRHVPVSPEAGAVSR
ncbi:hypothetical protein AB0C38_25100 [Amycolatopsis sp. NPDC048633]|uniref:hypothetical protein n=1 Tax=Amycolatopsis sp. NPDC048633 TaxID=3157095 RepID=UPI0033D74460